MKQKARRDLDKWQVLDLSITNAWSKDQNRINGRRAITKLEPSKSYAAALKEMVEESEIHEKLVVIRRVWNLTKEDPEMQWKALLNGKALDLAELLCVHFRKEACMLRD